MSSSATIDTEAGTLVGAARQSLHDAVSVLDCAELSGEDAADLYADLVDISRVVAAAKYSLTVRLDSSGVARDRGFRNTASMLADVEDVGLGLANGAVRAAKRLASCPVVGDALARGEVSDAQARIIADAVSDTGDDAPRHQAALLAVAGSESWTELDVACRRVKANAAHRDPVGAYDRIHAGRFVKHWTDEEGALRLSGRFTPDRGAKVLAALEAVTQVLFDQARSAGVQEPLQAYTADALCGMVINGLPDPGSKSGASSRSPRTVVHVRIDLPALLRGYAIDHELSEITGVGPIPVPVVQDLMTTAGVRAIFHHAEDIAKIFHFKRTINQHLLTALIERDPCCVVPGCGATQFLEIDHIQPFAEGGPTTLGNLARLCWYHHHQKTTQGYVLTKDADGWHFFDPQPPFGQEPGLGVDTPEGQAWLKGVLDHRDHDDHAPESPDHPPPKS